MSILKSGTTIGGFPAWHEGNHGEKSGLVADTIACRDTRDDGDILPNGFPQYTTTFSFTDEILNSPNAWDGVITVKGWSDSYAAWQLFSSSHVVTNEKLFFRAGVNTSWNGLKEVSLTDYVTPYNTIVGYQAGHNLSTGTHNILHGYQSGYNNTTGSQNIGLGYHSLHGDPTSKLTGADNVGIGYYTGYLLSTGSNNVMIGKYAGQNITTGDFNVVLGYSGLGGPAIKTGNYNIILGYQTGYNMTDGAYNNFQGTNTGYYNTSGDYNIFQGHQTGYNNTTGHYNVFHGYRAGYNHTSGDYNIGIGYSALLGNASSKLTGNHNIGIGHSSGLKLTTGHSNLFLGHLSGDTLTTGYRNVCLGQSADTLSNNDINSMAIGYATIGKGTNTIVLGNTAITSLWCKVNTISSLSDIRDKTDISDNTLGLDFITKINPINYRFDDRDRYEDGNPDGSKKDEQIQEGLSAQQVREVCNELNIDFSGLIDDDPDNLAIGYTKLIMPLINAVKELNNKIKVLEDATV